MKKSSILLAAILIAFGIGLSSALARAQADATASAGAAGPEGIRAATVLTIHGTVAAVDKAEKLVTIQVPDGRKYTLKVDNPYNLNAATVGAGVVVRYYEVVSVRKKKPGESLPSLSVTGGVVTAKAGGLPGAVAEEHLNAVVSVVEVDKTNGTAKANNPKILSHLKAGDDLVITTSRATAISLDKEPAK
jgi:hypothetical protein